MASPGFDVTMRHSSRSLNNGPATLPGAGGCRQAPGSPLASAATFSSPSTCFVPDGAQSDPRHSRTPAARAAATSSVPP